MLIPLERFVFLVSQFSSAKEENAKFPLSNGHKSVLYCWSYIYIYDTCNLDVSFIYNAVHLNRRYKNAYYTRSREFPFEIAREIEEKFFKNNPSPCRRRSSNFFSSFFSLQISKHVSAKLVA